MAIIKKVVLVIRCNFCHSELENENTGSPVICDSEHEVEQELKEKRWHADVTGHIHICDICSEQMPKRILQFF